MTYYVKHKLQDGSVETFHCSDHSDAKRMCRAFEEVRQTAWVLDEHGRPVPVWAWR